MPIGNATWGDFTANTEEEMTSNTQAVVGTTCLRTDTDLQVNGLPGVLVTLARLPASDVDNWQATVGAGTVVLSTGRNFTDNDDGLILECTAPGLTMQVPVGLQAGWACAIIPNGTTTIKAVGGAKLNGDPNATLTRAATANAMFGIVGRASDLNDFVVGGA